MPRKARFVIVGTPHHVTQRGNRRMQTFYTDEDRIEYLELLEKLSKKYELDILSYCLMPNHVHLIAVPCNKDSLQRAMKDTHSQYARRINKRFGWSGHLWQDRYFSSPLDQSYTWNAIKYVELNPVRANIIGTPEQFKWSSAQARCGLVQSTLLSQKKNWNDMIAEISDWKAWLHEGLDVDDIEVIRKATNKDFPCGSEEFIDSLELIAQRPLRALLRGRPTLRKK